MITLLSVALFSAAHALPEAVDANGVYEDDGLELTYGEDVAAEGIINGQAATIDTWPESGAMVMGVNAFGTTIYSAGCSSTLIAPDTVLLAAHCIDPTVYQQQGIDIDATELYFSRQADLSGYTLPADAVRVKARARHADFNIFGMGLGVSENSDIALLFLDVALTENPLAVLPTAEEAAQVLEGNAVSVVGWGQQTATAQGTQPPAGTVGIKMAGVSHIAELGTYELKVGEVVGDVRKCHGDSGGPSFMEVQTESLETWRQIGVTSHSYDMTDCSQTGGVDTRVDAYLPWIDAQMRGACEDGTRVWCEEPGIIPPEMPEPEEAKACGCSSSPVGSLGFGLLLTPFLLRRRR
ncbi:MAG: trypsin-like serine protease [Proteobacteria bacterium]|nr:trypsin-like serine protease [Pseudomonadota bacterium]